MSTSRFTAILTASTLSFALLLTGFGATAAHADMPDHNGGAVADSTYVAPNTVGLRAGGMRAMATSLPASVDLRRWSVPVGDQGQVNSCVAWSIGYSMLGWYANYFEQPQKFAPMYVYSQIHLPNDSGSYVQDAYDLLGSQGIVAQSQYPQGNNDFTTQPSANQKAQAAANKTTAPHWLYQSDSAPGDGAQVAIETAIAANHPVALGIELYAPIYKLWPGDSVLRGSQISASSASDGGHEVLVVGYNEVGVQIQNQWGTDWGDHGYATLDWDFVKRYSRDASWIWGFQSMLPAQVPGSPDRVQLQSYNGVKGRSAIVYWNGTGDYDDSQRNPVTSFTATLNGSDGSSRSVDVEGSSGVKSTSWSGLDSSVNYTVSLYAKNAVGSSAATKLSFLGSDNRIQYADGIDVPSPAMPAGAAVNAPVSTAPTPSPSVSPSSPAPSKPKYTKPSNVRYPSLVTSKSHGKIAKVRLNWIKPAKLGGSKLSSYTVKVTGKLGAKSKYSRTFTLSKSSTQKAFSFTGAGKLPRGLKYTFSIYAKTAAKLTSSGYSWKVVKA